MPVAEYELYKRIKLLGEGSFGKAYLVECLSDGSLCVIKQVDLSKMSEQEKKDTLKEAKILEALRHPNIVKFREVYKTKKGKLCIVMDYADGGDLSSKVKERRGQLMPENQILDWFTQICLALKHVHDRKIIHRDLKCQNIFLTKNGIIKLGDFGIARVLSNTRENARTMVGTPYYLSPEIIENKPYSFKSDMWSLGVVLYELCALNPPFTGNSLHFLALKIVKGSYSPIPSTYSKELKGLVASLLQTDPSKRPTANSILAMPFIQARIKNFLTETVRVTEFSHTVLHKEKLNVNNIKMDDLKNVINEAPMPDHLLKQLKQQQQQPKQQGPIQNAGGMNQNNQQRDLVQQKPNQILADQKQINGQNGFANKIEVKNNQQLGWQPKPQDVKENYHAKQDPNPIRQKDMIIQNILAKKEQEKQAQLLIMNQQQQVAKQNYHYRNQQQQLAPSPISKDIYKQNFEQAVQQHRIKEQAAAQHRPLENPGPRLNRQPSDLKADEKKIAQNRMQLDRKEPQIVKYQQDAFPARPKWEQKAVVNQQPPTPSSRQRDRLAVEGKAEVKPAIENKPKPQADPVLFKKPSQRDLFSKPVPDEALYGAFVNPNFIGNKKKPAKKVQKAQEVKPKTPVIKKSEQPQAVNKVVQQNNALEKLAEQKFLKQEEERLKRERQEAEQNARKAELEKKKAEKEKEREALRAQMQKDIQKKRNMKKQAGDFEVVFCGAKFSQEDSAPSTTGASEDTVETQQSERKEDFELTFKIDNPESKSRSASPEKPQQPRKMQWQIERNNVIDTKPETSENPKENNSKEVEATLKNETTEGREAESLAPHLKNKNLMRESLARETTDFNLSLSEGSEDPWENLAGETTRLAEFYEEEKKREQRYDQIKKGFTELNAFQKMSEYASNRRDQEEIGAYEALIKELTDIVTEPGNLDNNAPDTVVKEEANESSDQEDRDDDDDDISEDVKKEPKQEKPDDFIISDYNKLESLKVFMEDAFGDEIFLRAYHITKDLFNSKASIEEIEAQYAKEDRYASLFPFMSKDLRERYIPLMFTFVIMENIAEESSAAY